MVDGQPLIAHVAAALRPQVSRLVIVGRDWGGLQRVNDLPRAGLGPLAGLAGALHLAEREGLDAVLLAPCDTLGLPADLAVRLAPPPAVIADQWTVGLWPATLAQSAIAWLNGGGSLRLRDWAGSTSARKVPLAGLSNINRQPAPEGNSSTHF
jgi:molybdopterin-guanine dinucleotide biosynthesis protein A